MRQAGILMSIQSMPNRFGIGDFGPKSYEFVDLLKKTGMTIWQILPLNPLGYGNSPYQPYSSKAMDECYISLEERMACGIGACLACVCKTKEKDHHTNVNNKRICKEGPVFNAKEVEL